MSSAAQPFLGYSFHHGSAAAEVTSADHPNIGGDCRNTPLVTGSQGVTQAAGIALPRTGVAPARMGGYARSITALQPRARALGRLNGSRRSKFGSAWERTPGYDPRSAISPLLANLVDDHGMAG